MNKRTKLIASSILGIILFLGVSYNYVLNNPVSVIVTASIGTTTIPTTTTSTTTTSTSTTTSTTTTIPTTTTVSYTHLTLPTSG